MTALEELTALVQNYAVSAVEILGTQSGVVVRLYHDTNKSPVGSDGATAEEAAHSALECWRRKMRPKTNAPAVVERP
jgi:hypothetical protein